MPSLPLSICERATATSAGDRRVGAPQGEVEGEAEEGEFGDESSMEGRSY